MGAAGKWPLALARGSGRSQVTPIFGSPFAIRDHKSLPEMALHLRSRRRMMFERNKYESIAMPSLFPQSEPEAQLVGIARLAAHGEALSEGHHVEYRTLENRSLLTRCNSPRMPFAWQINPYRGCEFACKYCYARYTHEFMEMRDGLDFERKIYVKKHTAWLLRQELRQVRSGQSIAIGTATDP